MAHSHGEGGRVLLTSVHPERGGDPAELDRAEMLRARVAVTLEAEGLIG